MHDLSCDGYIGNAASAVLVSVVAILAALFWAGLFLSSLDVTASCRSPGSASVKSNSRHLES